jgi:hypothetical protein
MRQLRKWFLDWSHDPNCECGWHTKEGRHVNIVCTMCGWTGAITACPTNNDCWSCPECGMDESGLHVMSEKISSTEAGRNIGPRLDLGEPDE